LETNRKAWVDLSFAVGTFLAVWANLQHLYSFAGFSFANFLYVFFIPLLFFLQGVIDKERTLSRRLADAFLHLLVPYVLFYALVMGIIAVCGTLKEENFVFPLDRIIRGFYIGNQAGLTQGQDVRMLSSASWFLLALFWCKLFHHYAAFLFKKYKPLYFAAVLAVIGAAILLKTLNVILWWSINPALLCIPFFEAGWFLQNHTNWTKNENRFAGRERNFFLLVILCFGILVVTTIFNAPVVVSFFIWGKNLAAFYLGAAAGIALVVLLCREIPFRLTGVRLVAQNYITIMILQEALFLLLNSYLPGFNRSYHFIITVPITIATIIVLLFVSLGIRVIIKPFTRIIGHSQNKTGAASATLEQTGATPATENETPFIQKDNLSEKEVNEARNDN
jgi:hypothetical protein